MREDLGAALLDVSTSLAFGEAMGNMASTMALVAGLDHAPPADASGGVTFPSGSTPLVADLRVLFDAIGSVLQHSFPRLGRLLIRATPTFRRANRRVSAYLERRASDAQAALDSGGLGEASVDNVLDLLLIRAGQPANHMPMDELRDELLTFVLAGADTTAIAIGWARALSSLVAALTQQSSTSRAAPTSSTVFTPRSAPSYRRRTSVNRRRPTCRSIAL